LNRQIQPHPLVPAQAGTQWDSGKNWVPAFAETSDEIDLTSSCSNLQFAPPVSPSARRRMTGRCNDKRPKQIGPADLVARGLFLSNRFGPESVFEPGSDPEHLTDHYLIDATYTPIKARQTRTWNSGCRNKPASAPVRDRMVWNRPRSRRRRHFPRPPLARFTLEILGLSGQSSQVNFAGIRSPMAGIEAPSQVKRDGRAPLTASITR
jgi:hypothetical protein